MRVVIVAAGLAAMLITATLAAAGDPNAATAGERGSGDTRYNAGGVHLHSDTHPTGQGDDCPYDCEQWAAPPCYRQAHTSTCSCTLVAIPGCNAAGGGSSGKATR